MTAEELLKSLESQDVQLISQDGKLQIDAPKGVMNDSLRQQVIDHKLELIEMVRDKRDQAEPSPALPLAHIAQMPLDEFAHAGLIVEIWSDVLGSKVLLVSDNVKDAEIDAAGLPTYRASEMQKLAVLRPEPWTLRQIHEVKTLFNGSISDVTSAR